MVDRTLLYRFFEGKASTEEEELVKDWLESSPDNRSFFMKERKLYDAILLVPEKKQFQKGKTPSVFLREILKIAAVFLVVWGGSYLYYHSKYSERDNEYQTVYVPVGQRINLTLPDGTNVWLNSRTELKYPVSFDDKERHVILNGEAYFNVSKNKKKPFIVQTKEYNVAVLGTEFNVEAYSDRDEFKTTLIKGKVKIASLQNQSESIVLNPNQMAYTDNGKLCTSKAKNLSALEWKDGLICFKNTSFSDMMDSFEKYYGLNIYIENEQVIKHLYTGKFHLTDSIDYILKVLQKDIGFTCKFDLKNNTIYIQ